jgi:hypothetical protein
MPRRASLLLLLATLVLLPGCVWSRLLSWQGQLKEFDRYIVAEDDGPVLVLRFKEPCIRPADIGYLLGGDAPSRLDPQADGGVVAIWQLRRDRPDSIGLEIGLGAADAGEKTLADSLRVPPQVLQFLPKDRLLAMARAFGKAEIDRGKREASAGVSGAEAKPPTPGRAVIVAALGEPDAQSAKDGSEHLVYRFHLVTPDGALGKVSTLTLEVQGQNLLSARLQAPNFNAWMRFNE